MAAGTEAQPGWQPERLGAQSERLEAEAQLQLVRQQMESAVSLRGSAPQLSKFLSSPFSGESFLWQYVQFLVKMWLI
ncbi:MAG: hypothetical protein AAB613_02225 [Patescibacteria group bacterium]